MRGKVVWLHNTLQVMPRIRESDIGDAAQSSVTAFMRVGWPNVKGCLRNDRDADEPHENIQFFKPLTGGIERARDHGILGYDWRRRKSSAEVKAGAAGAKCISLSHRRLWHSQTCVQSPAQ